MSKIEINKNSITSVYTDAIVNAANSKLRQGGGVCGHIFEAAGAEELAEECNAIGYCEVGSAVITSGCALKEKNGNKFIIHAVGPKYSDGKHGEPEKLYSCYRKSLWLAKEKGCKSVTFPLISAGIFGYPKKEAWQTAIKACNDFICENPDYDINIVFVGLDQDVLNMGKDILKAVQAPVSADLTHKPEYVFFWKNDEENGCFSNWYESSFTVEGVDYWCAEQYMMAHKALVFNDLPVYEKIMKSKDQHAIKALGKQVHNFDSSLWAACKEEIVYNACFAKFSQNSSLKNELINTFGKELVEASPNDKIWGIGMTAECARETDSAEWPGQNLLGKTLARVRSDLMLLK